MIPGVIIFIIYYIILYNFICNKDRSRKIKTQKKTRSMLKLQNTVLNESK